MSTYTDEQKTMLRRVADQIADHPERFDISSWINYDAFVEHDALDDVSDAHWCGTTACIAGWAAVLGTRDADPTAFTKFGDWKEAAAVFTVRETLGADGFGDAGAKLLGEGAAGAFMPENWRDIVQTEDFEEEVEEHCGHCGATCTVTERLHDVRYLSVDHDDPEAVAKVLRSMANWDLPFEDAIFRLAEEGDDVVAVSEWESW